MSSQLEENSFINGSIFPVVKDLVMKKNMAEKASGWALFARFSDKPYQNLKGKICSSYDIIVWLHIDLTEIKITLIMYVLILSIALGGNLSFRSAMANCMFNCWL